MTTGLFPRIGVRTRDLSDERLRYIQQLGVSDVFVDPMTEEDINDPYFDASTDTKPEGLLFHRDRAPTVEELTRVRKRIEATDLQFAGIQTVPSPFYEGIALGTETADTQLEWYKELVRNAGRAGVPIIGYQWSPGGVYRTSKKHRIRGGAIATDYVHEQLEPKTCAGDYPTEAELWDNYERFLERILPVAQEAGVQLALHPDDPPTVEALDGMPRLFREVDAFERAMEAVPSEVHGLKLCLGCFSEMPDVDVVEVVRQFDERDEIVFIHFRDVEGTVPSFHETFADMGNFDSNEIIRTLVEVEFSGVMIPDHVPEMEGDTEWGHRSRGYTVGYLTGLLDAVERDV